MSRRKVLLLVFIICATVAAGGAAWHRYTHSPHYALRQIAAAAREHNRLKFERYVDLERFCATTVDELMGWATLSTIGKAESGFAVLGAIFGAGAAEKMKPALAGKLRSAILDAVENGRFDSLFTASRDTGGRDLTLALVAQNVAAKGLRFTGTGALRREGDVATIELLVRNDLLDTTLVLRARLERTPDRWRVVAPDNLRDYLETVDGLERRRLARVNQERRAHLVAAVSVGPVRREVRTHGFSDYVVLNSPLRNTGRDTIITAILTLYVDGEAMDRDDVPFGTVTPIAPGHTATALGLIDYNQFIDWHRHVRYADRLRAEPWLVITRRGARQDTLVEYGSWAEYAERF